MRSLSLLAIVVGIGGCSGDIVGEGLPGDGPEVDGGISGLSDAGADGGLGSDAAMVDDGEPAELTGITAAHNQVRAGVGVAPLTWDPALAQIALDWASQCIDVEAPVGLVDHNAGRSDNYPGYVGENIAGSTGIPAPQQVVDGWASEVVDYDYDTNVCAIGKVCGHYTQVVWANTERVGCAYAACPNLTFNVIVCDYSPGGNYEGQSPY